MRVFPGGSGRLGTKAWPAPQPPCPLGLGAVQGGPRPPLPSRPFPLWFLFPFPASPLCKRRGVEEERRVSGWERGSLQGGSQPGLGPGLGLGLQGRQAGRRPPCPPPPSSAESWGPGARQRGWGGLIGSPAPGGSRAPRPARGAARLCSLASLLPSRPRVPGQGMSCSRRSLPGARGQGGPARPTLCSPPPPRPGASWSRSPKEPSHRGRP